MSKSEVACVVYPTLHHHQQCTHRTIEAPCVATLRVSCDTNGVPLYAPAFVDDFGIKYQVKQHTLNLINPIEGNYEFSTDWTSTILK